MDKKQSFIAKHRKLIILMLIMITVIAIEVGITVGVHFILVNSDDNAIKNKMITISENIINEFDKTIDILKYVLKRNAAFIRIYGPIMSKKNYLDMLQLDDFPLTNVTEGNLFVHKVANNDLYTFQDLCNQTIKSNCMITELDTVSNSFVPVKNNSRPYYWPVTFFQSVSQYTDPFIGFDFITFPATAFIIQHALSSETNFTMSFRITLTGTNRENPNNHAILISTPSFMNDTDKNSSEIYGLVWLVPRVGNLFDYAISKINISIERDDIDLFVFDISDDGFANNSAFNISSLYKEINPEYANIWFTSDMTSDYSIISYNHTRFRKIWTIYFKFSSKYIKSQKNNQIIIIPSIIGGLFLLVDIIIIVLYLLFITILKRVEVEKERKTIAVQMLGYVNHEVRNPLNVIKGLSQFTLDTLREFDKYDENDTIKLNKVSLNTVISDLCTVCGACDMLEHIVTDILDIRKLESKKLDIDNKTIQLDEFMKDLIKTISQKINEKQVEFILIYDTELIIFIDPYRLKQILLNYLTNAIKFTDDGSITVKVDEFKDKIRFSVIDTGRGISDDTKNKIFQPFNQIRVDDSTRYGGIGLGLYLCKMLTECMDGTTGFISEFEKGSTFWSEFPKLNGPKLDEICIDIFKTS